MKHLFPIVLLAASLAAQSQIARFDFQNQLGSAQPSFAFNSDVWLSGPHQFAGPANQRVLSLPLAWNAGGVLSFTMFPDYGQTIDLAHLQWFVMPNSPGVADCVSAVAVTANGIQVAQLATIPQNTVIDIDLTAVPSLQNRTQPVTFEFWFVGNPTGSSSHEIDFIQLTGTHCDLELHTVAPSSLPVATNDYFQIIGAGFRDAQGNSNVLGVTFGSTVLVPYYPGSEGTGTYEVFTQWKLRIRPPQCLPPGPYTVSVTTACDTKSIQVVLTDPITPTIVGETAHPTGMMQCVTIHAGGPGPQVVILFWSPYAIASDLPGLLHLDIGGGWSLFLTQLVVADCGTFCVPVPAGKYHEWHYHQGVIWHSSNLGLTQPLPTTSVLGTYFY